MADTATSTATASTATAVSTTPITRAWTDVSSKVSGGALAGAVTLIIAFTLRNFGIDLPGDVTGALAVVIGFATSYVIPDQRALS